MKYQLNKYLNEIYCKNFWGYLFKCQKLLYFLAILISNFSKIGEESKSSPKIELYSILKVATMSCRRTNVRRRKHNQQINAFEKRFSRVFLFVLEVYEKGRYNVRVNKKFSNIVD